MKKVDLQYSVLVAGIRRGFLCLFVSGVGNPSSNCCTTWIFFQNFNAERCCPFGDVVCLGGWGVQFIYPRPVNESHSAHSVVTIKSLTSTRFPLEMFQNDTLPSVWQKGYCMFLYTSYNSFINRHTNFESGSLF